MIEPQRLWELAGNQGQGARVAMLDTGIDASHRAFEHIELLQSDLCGGINPGDIDGHGTQCCGAILSVAPQCTLLSGKILSTSGSFTNDALISGLFWASRNSADIICVCTGDRYPDPDVDSVLTDFHNAGRMVVAAIGNGRPGGGGNGMFPARYKHAIAAGTANEDGSLASFCELSPDKEVICLPGIHFTVPVPGGKYKSVTGTSMSAAIMAGLIALCVAGRKPPERGEIFRAIAVCSEVRQSPRGPYRLLDPVSLVSRAY